MSGGEIAAFLGWKNSGTASTLWRRGMFPAPVIDKPRAKLWRRADVEEWARTAVVDASGRPRTCRRVQPERRAGGGLFGELATPPSRSAPEMTYPNPAPPPARGVRDRRVGEAMERHVGRCPVCVVGAWCRERGGAGWSWLVGSVA